MRLQKGLVAVIIALAAGALVLVPSAARGSIPGYVTYRGEAGGGTISITLSDDLSVVARVALDGVTFTGAAAPCNGTVTITRYFDPPEPVASGNLSAFLVPVGLSSGEVDYVTVSGSVIEGSASGSASYGVAVAPEVGCNSDAAAFEASGPIETPPGPDDLTYSGSIEGATGALSLTLSPDRTAVTSAGFDELLMPCDDAVAVTLAALLDPPAPIDAETGAFLFNVVVHAPDVASPIIRSLSFSGAVDEQGGIAGTVDFIQISIFCDLSDLAWSAQLVPATTTPTATATTPAAPAATATPTSGAQPVALPDAGGGGRSSGSIGLVAIGLLLGAGALAAGATRLRAR